VKEIIVFWWIVIGVVVLVLLYLGWTYNRLISLNRRADGAWSDIDVQLKRRWELVPNLVETVKGYAAHERTTFEEVTRARGAAMEARDPAAKAQAETGLTQSLRSLFAVAERYPELRANQNFLALQTELSTLEEAIQNARRYYNAIVRDLNTAVETFPGNLVAGMFGIGRRDYFELGSEAERSAPRVSFGS
jgi:LemA protein